MARITSLTPQQEALLQTYRQDWFRVGTCTDRADRRSAESAILAMRREIGVTRAPVFIWCESPAGALLALHYLRSPEYAKWVAGLPELLRVALQSAAPDSLWASLRDSLGDARWGQHEAYWIAFYLFCRDILGVQYDEKRSRQLDMWRDVAKSCCWWWPYENYVFISERPTVVAMEAVTRAGSTTERLHSAAGPAVAFADGWAVYAWHGTRVPEQVILAPDTLTPKQIQEERNAEVRRAMLERFGTERFIRESGATVVHEDETGKLLRAELDGDEPLMMVEVINSTPEPDGSYKHCMLRVDPKAYGGLTTAHAAVASTWRKPGGAMVFERPEDYRPAVES